jgi:hypothetical protein
MDSEQLDMLAQDVMDLLKQYKIPAEVFTMRIRVPREYYETIKENFPDRHPIDRIVGKGEENWAINISYSIMQQGGAYTEQSEPPMR